MKFLLQFRILLGHTAILTLGTSIMKFDKNNLENLATELLTHADGYVNPPRNLVFNYKSSGLHTSY